MRRSFVLTIVMVLIGSAALSNAAGPVNKMDFEKMRTDMLNRQRRIILNNDGNDVIFYPADKEVNAETFLEKRTSPLADSQVDSIFYCTISSGFGNFTHNTRIGSIHDYDVAKDRGRTEINAVRPFLAQGTDSLKITVDWCRKNGKEIFWSMRMNDTHDAAGTPEKPHYLFQPLKKEHPEWLLGSYDKRPKRGRWSAVDYGRPEIRDLAFAYIEEVCKNYDVDGIEMDFFRHMNYFKSVADGGKATQQDLDEMTALVRRVRKMTEEVGMKRGRPILVAIRVPDSVEYCRDSGLDLERWLSEGLADILITTCYFQLNPWEYSVKLGHKYGVKVYPSLSESRITGEIDPYYRDAAECYRARAAQVWESGADGVYLYNFFRPKDPLLREIGDPKTLAGLEKTYFISERTTLQPSMSKPDHWLAGGDDYLNVPMLSPQDPLIFNKGEKEVRLLVGGDAGKGNSACHIRGDQLESLKVFLNGTELSERSQDGHWTDFSIPRGILTQGYNTFRLVSSPIARTEKVWSMEYDGDSVPEHFNKYSSIVGVKPVSSVEDGALRLAKKSSDTTQSIYYWYPWNARRIGENRAEIEVKAVSGWNCIVFGNGLFTERIIIYPDRIETLYSQLSYEMDTTDEFHTYTIVFGGIDFQIFVDGELKIDGRDMFIRSGGGNEIRFGTWNDSLPGEALWRAVRWKTGEGPAIFDMAVTVTGK